MVIHCAACETTECRLTGKTHYWIDADGGWEYHEVECLHCRALMWLDERGFTHVLSEKQTVTPLDLKVIKITV